MLRCRHSKPRNDVLRRYKRRAPISTGKSRTHVKREKDAAEAAQIRTTHDRVWERDATCRYCLGMRSANRATDAMHEDPSRAKTRGLPPEQRFNAKTCGRACARCHADLTGDVNRPKMRTEFLEPDRGFNGPIRPLFREGR